MYQSLSFPTSVLHFCQQQWAVTLWVLETRLAHGRMSKPVDWEHNWIKQNITANMLQEFGTKKGQTWTGSKFCICTELCFAVVLYRLALLMVPCSLSPKFPGLISLCGLLTQKGMSLMLCFLHTFCCFLAAHCLYVRAAGAAAAQFVKQLEM